MESVRSQGIPKVELVIVAAEIGKLYPADYLREVELLVMHSAADRSIARNIGAALARSDVLIFIDSDMTLSNDLVRECITKLQSYDALILRETTETGRSYWASCRAFERASMYGTELFEAARCIRADVFSALGGYDPVMTGLEDMDFQARLKERGARIGWVDANVTHLEEGIGPLLYARKRKAYAQADFAFRKRHPARWRQLTSPIARMRLVVASARAQGLRRLAEYSPGLIVQRGLEFASRWSVSRSLDS